jgi:hydroxyacylglutathione hydrolase
MFEILALRAFSDNYIWTLLKDNEVTVVDPGDPKPVISFLEKRDLTLNNILITHHHYDHTGGIQALAESYSCEVYGPKGDHIEGINKSLTEGDEIEISGIKFSIFSTPGHTLDHISYFADVDVPLLFCGDTLFSGGCGRLFEGTPEQMFNSLNKFSILPSNTQVFCTHEYTESNLTFAVEVEPYNKDLNERLNEVREMRREDKITLPSTISTELKINPFLRCHREEVIQAAQNYSQTAVSKDEEVLGVIRNWKDNF